MNNGIIALIVVSAVGLIAGIVMMNELIITTAGSLLVTLSGFLYMRRTMDRNVEQKVDERNRDD